MDLSVHREDLINLNIEYMTWIFDQIEQKLEVNAREELGPVDEYIRSKIDDIYSFKPPDGFCYLVKENNQFAGMGAFRRIRDGVAEIKRMYIKPEYRGRGLGKQLIHKLIEQIKIYNYNKILLDTAPFMEAAHGLYKKMGFRERDQFPESEVPEQFRHLWNYMEMKL
jgi:ribosomal protein S18 acetylase RimI-like enzyme